MKETIIPYKVEITDLDYMGIMAHYKWIEMFETTRFSMLEMNHWPLSKAWEIGVGAVVSQIHVKFHGKVRYGQTLSVHITPCRSFEEGCWLDYKVYDETSRLVTESEQMVVFIDIKTGKKRAMPPDLKEIFSL